MKKSNIKKIEILKNYNKKFVYDITVKDNHNYFTNTALVHNCIVIDESLSSKSLLLCEDGIKRTIQDIVQNKLKVKIATYNLENQKIEFSNILNYWEYPCTKECFSIEYEVNGKIKKLRCTEDHLIYTENRGDVQAKDLMENDEIVLNSQKCKITEKIKKIKKIKKLDKVYDIETENHNFFANDMLVHNSHMVSDISYSSKIRPMLTAHKYYQLIEIGVAMYKNHFNRDFNNKDFVICSCDWLHADRLKESGIFMYNGKEYPQSTVDLMPPEAKKKYFPDRPDLITGSGGISYLDFMMQYELVWMDDISLFLNETQQKQLLAGNYNILEKPLPNGIYIFGLDTAAGGLDPETLTLDFTSLSIWEYRAEKLIRVYGRLWQGDPILQYAEIKEVLQRFHVKYGLADYSNIAPNFIAMFKKDGINCDGIQYERTCPESHKDYKTTIFENFLARLNLNQITYPNIDILEQQNPNMSKDLIENFKEGFSQWCVLTRVKSKKSDRVKINAPNGWHDDVVNSDCLAVFSLNNLGAYNNQVISNIPFIISGTTFMSNQGGPIQNQNMGSSSKSGGPASILGFK